MHPTVDEFTQRVVREHKLNTTGTRVLIVGSLDVNGSVRPYFDKCDVIGVDMTDGPGVDAIVNAHDLLGPYGLENLYGYGGAVVPFDVIVCTEMLEHDDEFWTTLYNIGVLLRPGGYLILTARGVNTKTNEVMPEHAYPDDYYRFMPNVVPKLLRIAGCDTIEDLVDTWHPGFLALGQRV